MNGLALYAGYGGLELAIGLIERDYKTVCYVEREASCAANLVARMEAQELHQAPIWDDSGTFEGKPWRGTIDILTAGFPCPEVSIAGKRKGVEGERWLWRDVARIIREARPQRLLLENVRGILSANDGSAHAQVLGDLAENGFDVWWGSVPASRLGARHQRDRIFYVAHANGAGHEGRWQSSSTTGRQDANGHARLGSGNVGNANEQRRKSSNGQPRQSRPHNRTERPSGALGNTDRQRRGKTGQCDRCEPDWYGGGLPSAPPGPNEQEIWQEISRIAPKAQPAIYGMADGTTQRVDRLRMCGNGVYTLAATYAWLIGNAALATTNKLGGRRVA